MRLRFTKQLIAFICVALAVTIFLINPFQLKHEANIVIAFAALMISLWVTEALPMPVVALLPLILFPLFNIAPIGDTAAAYANPVIFLFMGGFMLGLAIQKCNLHRRIALNIVKLTGTSGDRIILGFIIATGMISMWLSNTATTMMMFPIALSVVTVLKENHPDQKGMTNFSLSVMIAIALASNFGGIATLIGTPPNVAYAAFIKKKYDYTIAFSDWMMIGTPLAILLLMSLYLVMVKWLYPNRMKADLAATAFIHNEVAALGKKSTAEKEC